jgi:hypothetical protein
MGAIATAGSLRGGGVGSRGVGDGESSRDIANFLSVFGGRLGSHVRCVAAQVDFESRSRKKYITIWFQALSSKRFQLGFDRVNLHRPTAAAAAVLAVVSAASAATSAVVSDPVAGAYIRPLFSST